MSRFTLDGRKKVRFSAAAPADLAAPTVAEIGAMVDITGVKGGEALMDLQGFVASPSSIPTPDYIDNQIGSIPGDETYPDSSLAMYMDSVDRTVYTALAKGVEGYLFICKDGLSATSESECFPISVISRVRRPARGEAHVYDVHVSLGVPTYGVVTA